MLKISKQYLDSHKSHDQLTENSKKEMANLQQNKVNFTSQVNYCPVKKVDTAI